MAVAYCERCGRMFEQKGTGRPRRYCSDSCRVRACRERHSPTPLDPGRPVEVTPPPLELADAVGAARRASNDLARISSTGPVQVRAGAGRVSAAITAALDLEGW